MKKLQEEATEQNWKDYASQKHIFYYTSWWKNLLKYFLPAVILILFADFLTMFRYSIYEFCYGLLFVFVGFNFQIIKTDNNGISYHIFGLKIVYFPWDKIKELRLTPNLVFISLKKDFGIDEIGGMNKYKAKLISADTNLSNYYHLLKILQLKATKAEQTVTKDLIDSQEN